MMTAIRAALRRLLGETSGSGSRACLGRTPDKWLRRICDVCGGPATEYKTLPPWPGSSHWHTSMTCDEHRSYLDGAGWGSNGDGEWIECPPPESRCMHCKAPYGTCLHTAGYQAIVDGQEASAVYGRVGDV